MKKIILLLIITSASLSSCKKTQDVSTVATIPTMAIVGDEAITIPVGGSFTDLGAKLIDEDGSVSTIMATENPLNTNTPGFYTLRYKKITKSGYTATALRVVLVTSVSSSLDYSGTYVRTSNGQSVNVRKVGTGLYATNNVGGVPNDPAFVFDVYFGHTENSTIVVPLQDGGFGEVYCTNASLSATPADTVIKWAVMGDRFGTALRTFSRK